MRLLCCILICRCMLKHIQHKGCVWEGVEDRTNTATHWPPQLLWLSQPFFSVLLGCPTGGLGAQPLLGHGSHSSIFSPTDLNFLSPGLYNNFTSTNFLRGSQFAFNSTTRQSKSSPDILDRMQLLFTQVHFFFWQFGRGQYVTNIRHLPTLHLWDLYYYVWGWLCIIPWHDPIPIQIYI